MPMTGSLPKHMLYQAGGGDKDFVLKDDTIRQCSLASWHRLSIGWVCVRYLLVDRMDQFVSFRIIRPVGRPLLESCRMHSLWVPYVHINDSNVCN